VLANGPLSVAKHSLLYTHHMDADNNPFLMSHRGLSFRSQPTWVCPVSTSVTSERIAGPADTSTPGDDFATPPAIADETRKAQGSTPSDAGADTSTNRAPECAVCLGGIEGVAATEAVTLACGHRLHLACWLPCVLMVGGGDTAQERHIEDRLGRKCPACRGEFSMELTQALKSRRAVIREAEKNQIRDEATERCLRHLVPGHPLLPENIEGIVEGDIDEDFSRLPVEQQVDPLMRRMPMSREDLIDTLSEDALHDEDILSRVTRRMRITLQREGAHTSGNHNVLLHRMLALGYVTIDFFLKLDQAKLLVLTPPELFASIKATLRVAHRSASTSRRSARQQLLPHMLRAVGLEQDDQLPEIEDAFLESNPEAEPEPAPVAELLLSEEDEGKVLALVELGFSQEVAKRAYLECGRNEQQAANYLFSGAFAMH
jgi:hypothetical protein